MGEIINKYNINEFFSISVLLIVVFWCIFYYVVLRVIFWFLLIFLEGTFVFDLFIKEKWVLILKKVFN